MQRAVVLDEAVDAGIKQEFETFIDVKADAAENLTAGGEKVETQAADPDPEAIEPETKVKPLTDLAARAKAKRAAEDANAEANVERGDDPMRDERDLKKKES
jgi:hypothetical protein